MATFAKSTFSASIYAASRPTYPPELFQHILEYHRKGTTGQPGPRFDHAVDLGCGTGQATRPLKGVFKRVTCVDPSAGMLEKAKEILNREDTKEALGAASSFTFHQAGAEDLSQVIPESGTVDLLIAAQACHWFNWKKVWPETHRILRKGGSAAFWVYGEFQLPEYPSTAPLITAYSQGTDPNSTTSVGAHFQRPGRTMLERLLVDVPSPGSVLGTHSEKGDLTDFRRVYFSGSHEIPEPYSKLKGTYIYPVMMRASWTWLDLLHYLRTWSALHSYHERFPDDLEREDDSRFLDQDMEDARSRNIDGTVIRGGDISIRFWKDARAIAQRGLVRGHASGIAGSTVERKSGLLDNVEIEWPVSLLLTRKA
ncbi:S-adenosyl-L-methionine-dependent methyltransferase [Coprinopsis marcescibilis]|uniref:S-adenosyl-L-methionine-dependent methyltransferase n=1 Tax=Coprinopsis marcescibilis TaxID=230819 RepID=A0A5C3KTC2_COPMA|nr:S-adenosyl-L-methionine-dependent methyltransferase [Coprinopsis marcescibilis]